MLPVLDAILTFLHIAIIFFNLFGWIWPRTRTWHLYLVAFTWISWLILGLKYGFGYCFLTDWHWRVKRQLGEFDLPNSFVHYLFEKGHISMEPVITDYLTVISFVIATFLSLYLKFFRKEQNV